MKKLLLIINSCLVLLSTVYVHASPINLTEKDMYVRQGFDKKWITSLPDENDKNWQKFPANKDNRSVRVRQLKFKDIPKFRHFSLKKYPDMTFTYVTSFIINKENIESSLLGLYLEQIGQNWEVYINGNLLKSQMYISKDGTIDIERAVRGETIGINPHYLKTGMNILAFKIVGNPVDDRTGLFMKKGYYIDELNNLKSFKDYFSQMMLIAVYVFFGLYHLFLYIIRRKEQYNFAYGAFSIVFAVYMFCRNELVFSLFADTSIIKIIELVALAYFAPTSIILVELLCRHRITIVGKMYLSIMAIISLLIIFVWKESLLRVIQILGAIGLLITIIYSLILPFAKILSENYKIISNKTNKKLLMVPRAIMRSLLFSIPGNIIIGVIILFLTGIIDAINGVSGNPTRYAVFGFALFLLGIAGILANRFVKVHNSVEELNVSLEQMVEERTAELENANDELLQKSLEITIAQDKIMEKDRQKSKFLANMSHELRTPLNSINGIAELLRFGIYEKNEEIVEKMEKMINLLNDITQNANENHELSLMINNLKSVMEFTVEDGNLKRYFFLQIKEKLEKNNFFDSSRVLNNQIQEIFDTIDREEKDLFNAYKRIKESGDYLLELINSILNLSKIEAGKIEVKKCDTSVRKIVESVIDTAKSYAMTKQKEDAIDFKIFIEDSVPASIMIDDQKTKQVLLNYLSNGIKFTEKGDIKLSVQKMNSKIRFSVKDTGIGIKEEDRKNIFQEFERTENTRYIEGTGLGLAISKRLIELQGGRAGFESEFGKGSEFWFELPVEASDVS